ncbi:hypothetical protein OF829_02860 [Sphingomonas sp. LB-2]|uniref:hypothetical protein n=1 Tax=Sphingomonas caeni TaxID=2984949 RepID=UPI00222E8EE2|nr:hypothetical protein [Sphingomonas caeni]MCW3846163.1 hypothetical protein [Sphingomonas caeni]
MRALHVYDATLDRVGLALATGSALGGALVVGLRLIAGERNPMYLTGSWLFGAVFVAIGITAVVGPLWLVMHVAGLRRARHAALIGALAALVVFVGAQTWGFGLFQVPIMDNRTWLYVWLSALAVSAVLAVAAALIGVIMWRIAYRRQI